MGRVIVGVAVVAAAAFAALAVLVMAGWGPLLAVDRAVADGANAFAAGHPDWVRAMKVVTTVATPLVWRLLAAVLAVVLWVRGAVAAAAFTVAAVAGGAVLSTAIKVGVDRARPVVPHPYANAVGMAFPSGHATTATLACGVALVLLLPRLHGPRRAVAWLLAVLVPLAVGYTRIGLDVHWLSDVVGGWLLGVAVVAAAHAVMLRRRAGTRQRVSADPVRRSGRSR